MALKIFQRLADIDKAIISLSLTNAGVKASIRKTRYCFRVKFTGDQQAVIQALNDAGYRNCCGERFSHHSINDLSSVNVYMKD